MSAEVSKPIARTIWENKFIREAILLIVSALATQFVFSAAELVSAIDEAKDWTDLWVSGTAWVLAFSFAAVQTAIKQAVAYALSRAADRKLAGVGSESTAYLTREIASMSDAQLALLGVVRTAAV